MLADELRVELEEAVATVLGPEGTVRDALGLISIQPQRRRFVFCTGYDESAIDSRFSAIPKCTKPYEFDALIETIQVAGRLQ